MMYQSSRTPPTAEEFARQIRLQVVRMVNRGGSSHVGSALSIVDILAVLYGRVLHVDPTRPRMAERDRFFLSKGHAGAAVYATLALRGFFPLDKLDGHGQDGADLSGHVSHKGVPGVELSTGSLGHALPVACGMAYGAKLDGRTHRHVVLLSDGECDEGSNWEAALFAAHHKLTNVTAIVDYNKLQSLGSVNDTLRLEPFADKWRSFGWAVCEVDGHDHEALEHVLTASTDEVGKPLCVLAHTVKGKGVSYMENSVDWHYRTPRGDDFDRAIAELERAA